MYSTMKTLPRLHSKYVLVMLFASILIVNSIAVFYDFELLSNIAGLLTVPILVAYFFSRQHYMANVFFTVFLTLFLANVFSAFSMNDLTNNLSEAFSLGAYLLLVFVLVGKLKRVKFEGFITVYLVIVFLINTYLLYALYSVLESSFSGGLQTLLFVLKGIVLILMAFVAFMVYLSNESKQSILFLTMVFCFMFSNVLNYIHTMYVYFWLFEWTGYALSCLSVILFFKYVDNHHRKQINPEAKTAPYNDEQQVIKPSESVTV